MRRHQIGIVIGALGVDVVAARRLHADDDIAEAMQAEAKFSGRRHAGPAPGSPIATQRRAARSRAKLRTRPHNSRAATPRRQTRDARPVERVGRPLLQQLHHRGGVIGRLADAIAFAAHRGEHIDQALRRIEADAVGEPSVAVGIIGEHKGDTARSRFGPPQSHPGQREIGGRVDAIGHRLECRRRKSGQALAALLERDGIGKDAAIDFRQHDMHGEIARVKPARSSSPSSRGICRPAPPAEPGNRISRGCLHRHWRLRWQTRWR